VTVELITTLENVEIAAAPTLVFVGVCVRFD
jgi:hypothetical protein